MRAVWILGVPVVLLAHPLSRLSAQRATGPQADNARAFAVRMVSLLRARDAAAVVALYGDTTHYVHVENGVVIPWSQLSQMMRTYLATATSNPLRIIGEPGVTVIDANTAVVYVTHHFDPLEGRPAHDGVWTGVLHRDGGAWKVVHSHSSDRSPSEPAQRR